MNFQLIKPSSYCKEYGFQINFKKPHCTFFIWLDFTKRRLKYKHPFFNYEICPMYGHILKIGIFNAQITKW